MVPRPYLWPLDHPGSLAEDVKGRTNRLIVLATLSLWIMLVVRLFDVEVSRLRRLVFPRPFAGFPMPFASDHPLADEAALSSKKHYPVVDHDVGFPFEARRCCRHAMNHMPSEEKSLTTREAALSWRVDAGRAYSVLRLHQYGGTMDSHANNSGPSNEPSESPGGTQAPKPGTLKEFENSVNGLIPVIGRVLVSAWNIQMRFLIAVGLMPLVQKYPWVLFATSFLLLAFVYPLGIAFTATGIAAITYNARSKDQFLVDLDKRDV